MPKSVVLRLLPTIHAEVAEPNWIVGPCGQTRDSDLTEQANFTYTVEAMDELDPNGADHEVLSWHHWAVGWAEEMACRPGSECRALQEGLYEILESRSVISPALLEEMRETAAQEAKGDDTVPEVPAEPAPDETPYENLGG